MSSVDLHTHSGFQRMLPESFAVVCAPKFNPKYVFLFFFAFSKISFSSSMNSLPLFFFFVSFGIFRITDPPGLDVILNCQAKEAFHPHPDQAIYTVSSFGLEKVSMIESSFTYFYFYFFKK